MASQEQHLPACPSGRGDASPVISVNSGPNNSSVQHDPSHRVNPAGFRSAQANDPQGGFPPLHPPPDGSAGYGGRRGNPAEVDRTSSPNQLHVGHGANAEADDSGRIIAQQGTRAPPPFQEFHNSPPPPPPHQRDQNHEGITLSSAPDLLSRVAEHLESEQPLETGLRQAKKRARRTREVHPANDSDGRLLLYHAHSQTHLPPLTSECLASIRAEG